MGSSHSGFVIDTSAAVAVILGEAGSNELIAHLEAATVRLLSTATRVELGIVIEARLWPRGQDVVERFLRANPAFVHEAVNGLLPDAVVDENGFMSVLPHVHGCDGAFAARFRKT